MSAAFWKVLEWSDTFAWSGVQGIATRRDWHQHLPLEDATPFAKKTQQTPTQEIALAVRRKNDYLARGKSDE